MGNTLENARLVQNSSKMYSEFFKKKYTQNLWNFFFNTAARVAY